MVLLKCRVMGGIRRLSVRKRDFVWVGVVRKISVGVFKEWIFD